MLCFISVNELCFNWLHHKLVSFSLFVLIQKKKKKLLLKSCVQPKEKYLFNHYHKTILQVGLHIHVTL